MKISKERLAKLIKEELSVVIGKESGLEEGGASGGLHVVIGTPAVDEGELSDLHRRQSGETFLDQDKPNTLDSLPFPEIGRDRKDKFGAPPTKAGLKPGTSNIREDELGEAKPPSPFNDTGMQATIGKSTTKAPNHEVNKQNYSCSGCGKKLAIDKGQCRACSYGDAEELQFEGSDSLPDSPTVGITGDDNADEMQRMHDFGGAEEAEEQGHVNKLEDLVTKLQAAIDGVKEMAGSKTDDVLGSLKEGVSKKDLIQIIKEELKLAKESHSGRYNSPESIPDHKSGADSRKVSKQKLPNRTHPDLAAGHKCKDCGKKLKVKKDLCNSCKGDAGPSELSFEGKK